MSSVRRQTDVMLSNYARFLALLLFYKPAGCVDYCTDVANDCGGGKTNIMCRRNGACGPESNCKEVAIHKDVKDYMLDQFNDIRNKAAMGQGPISGKKAANMMAMSWDEELASIAQCAVNVCEERLKGACPVSSKYSYGHILYTNQMMVSFDDEFDFFEQTVKSWQADGEGMSSTSDFKGKHYDFGAMIMAKAGGVGCGWSKVNKPIFYHGYNAHFYFAACVFALTPSGDAYQDGEPCSKCPSGTSCNSRYKALCGEVTYAEIGPNEDEDYYDATSHDGCASMGASLLLLLSMALLAGVRF